MPKEISKAWKCNWCNKASINHGAIIKHENSCKKNPNRRHCGTCIYLCMEIDHFDTDSNGDPIIERYAPWCTKHNKPISEKPWLINCEKEEVDEYFGYINEMPLPWTCSEYKYKGYYGFKNGGELNDN